MGENKLTREGYQALIDEDVTWLEANAPHSLERDHIVTVLNHSVVMHYGPIVIGDPDE